MIYALAFIIGSSIQFISEPHLKVPFDYAPPRTIKKIRPNIEGKGRIILYPENGNTN